MNGELKKVCCICKNNLNVELFHKSSNSKDGFVGKCKNCVKEYNSNLNNSVPRITCISCNKIKWAKSFSNDDTCNSCKTKQLKKKVKNKKCKICNLKKDITQFCKNKSYVDGYTNKCKECVNSSLKTSEYKYKNRNRQNKYNKKRFFYSRATVIINRAKKNKEIITFSVLDLAKHLSSLWKKQRGLCLLTNDLLRRDNAQVDHIVPTSRGGKTDFDNLRWVIKDVNRIKGSMKDSEFKNLIIKLYKNFQ